MPIYEYRCRKCNREFEVVQSITAPELKSCKFCKGPVTKLMSVSSFHLKGSGWYVTDYGGRQAPVRESAAKSETAAEASAPATEAAPAAAASESKS